MAVGRTVNRERARRLRRERGLTYAEIAEELGCSWWSAYYACNPEKRQAATLAGSRRSLYVSDERWESLAARARAAGISRSAFVARLIDESAEPQIGPSP